MTENDLHTIVRDHVTSDEPPFLATPHVAIARGRRTLRRRRALTGGLCAAALTAVAAVTVPAYVGSDDAAPRDLAAASTPDYDASQMPQTLDERARDVLTRTAPDLPVGERAVTDDQGRDLPQERWDEASQMTVDYTLPGHEYRVSLLHARSEAEGDRAAICADEVRSGYALSCEVLDEEGTVVSVVRALRRTGDRGWAVVPKGQLDSIDPGKLWFEQTVESVRSETLVVDASETVKAPSLEDAAVRWHAPLNDLIEIATDPVLTFPAPTGGPNGMDEANVVCTWEEPAKDSGEVVEGDCPVKGGSATP